MFSELSSNNSNIYVFFIYFVVLEPVLYHRSVIKPVLLLATHHAREAFLSVAVFEFIFDE